MFKILHFSFCIVVSVAVLGQTPLTLEEAVRGQFVQFAPQDISQLQWLPGGLEYVYTNDTALYVGTVKKGEKVLFTLKDLNQLMGNSPLKSFPSIAWEADRSFRFEHQRRMAHVNLATRQSEFSSAYPEDAQNVDYASTSRSFAFTRANDLYVMSGGKELRVTSNPEGTVSGQSISRNEYGISKGTFWSPDGQLLAFYQKDESLVSKYPLTQYSKVPASVNEIRYPMAGGLSERVGVGIYNPQNGTTVFLDANNGREDDQHYLTNLAWTPDSKSVLLIWLNRSTSILQMKSYDVSSGKETKVLFSDKDTKWLEPLFAPVFLPTKPDQFVWITNRSGFDNVHYYHISGAQLGATNFGFDVLEILGFDKEGTKVYVTATGENATEQHAYEITLGTMSARKLTGQPGVHAVSISSAGLGILDRWSSLKTPNRITLYDAKGKEVRVLLEAANPLATKVIGTTEIFTIKSNLGDDLYCRLIKPSHFDPTKKYPVVVYVYNGPHVQLVNSGWLGGASLWMHYLAEQGYLVFTLDGHGSDHRGKAFEQAIHRQLGTQEMEDQLAGVNWLKQQPFVDANRLGIHGWSYGGFMTTSMMLRKPGVFKVGVAGGPVIDWRLYEVMYTERYMDTPEENPEGYAAADLTGYVKNLQGKLLMIHGTDDDVVVLQHNMRFQKACIDQGVQADFFLYPGHAHNVRGKDRVHLMRKIIDYLITGLE